MKTTESTLLTLIFEGPMLVGIDDREDYGEIRLIGIGYLNTIAVVIVFTEPSPEKIRVISIRKAIRYERERFEKAITNRLDET